MSVQAVCLCVYAFFTVLLAGAWMYIVIINWKLNRRADDDMPF